MGGNDSNFMMIYRGEQLENYQEGGGFWFGRTYAGCFWLELERPASLATGINYLQVLESSRAGGGISTMNSR
ncbi:hypothetical protein EHW64_15765 [Erwinia psidii]|uniref:Uncharacterized protein n=1 Tax=Erwinia psidii TaxID=69224 RepID=A0A3N6RXK1_9GAMM|nr:hypothetical protein [Erwinia psidii]MCX8962536.1 hypothetical protein [Erwinia psidii]RQM37117.1 hypothetical protein EB241_17105 [Erwinia psidii]